MLLEKAINNLRLTMRDPVAVTVSNILVAVQV